MMDSPTLLDESYVYDPIGNRLSSSAMSYTYNQNNELLAAGGTTYDRDANGNATRKTERGQGANYIYSAADRMTRVEDGLGNVIASGFSVYKKSCLPLR